MTVNGQPADRRSIHDELKRARTDLHYLVASATTADLRRDTDGTRWTNQQMQMLGHMVIGYLIVSRLLRLGRLLGRLPSPFSRAFAAMLNAGTRPLHHINYLGSVGGAPAFHGPRLTSDLDSTTTSTEPSSPSSNTAHCRSGTQDRAIVHVPRVRPGDPRR